MSQTKGSRAVENDGCQVRIIHLERVAQARKAAVDPDDLAQLSRILKALGDPTRLRIVMALLSFEMCVCDLAAVLGMSESAISHQLRRLRDLALVRNRREGQVLYYSLNDDHVNKLLHVALEHVRE